MGVNKGQTVQPPPERILAGPALTFGLTADGMCSLAALASKWLREMTEDREIK